MDDWYDEDEYDQSIIVYNVDDGKVYGGSDPIRKVKEVKKVFDGFYEKPFYPGGDFTMELDLSKRSFVMEINGEKITLDGNIGDFQYSPIVILMDAPQITLL